MISQEESVQQLGVINIVYNVGGFPKGGMDYEKSRRLSKVFRGVPVRFNSFLVCIDDSPWLNVVEVFSLMVNKFLRIRMRTIRGKFCRSVQCHHNAMLANSANNNSNHHHHSALCTHPIFLETKHMYMDARTTAGTHTECLYQLMALGIPYYALPVNEHSELELTDHYRWFNHQLEKEIQKKQQEMDEEDAEQERRQTSRRKRRHKRQRDHRHVKTHKDPDQMEQDMEDDDEDDDAFEEDSSATDYSIEEADHEDDVDVEYVEGSKLQKPPHGPSYSSFYFNHDAMSDLVKATSLHYLGGGRASTNTSAASGGGGAASSGSGEHSTTTTGQPTRLIG